MNQATRNVFNDIINCSNIKNATPPCDVVINYQKPNTTSPWQCPEPFVGHIDDTPLLFILSNPGYNADEVYPIVQNVPYFKLSSQNPTQVWSPSDIEAFFEDRFSAIHKQSGLPYVKQLSVLLDKGNNNWVYGDMQLTWLRILYYAMVIKGNTIQGNNINIKRKNYTSNIHNISVVPGKDFAILDVIHCKSQEQKGVNNAKKVCTQYLNQLLNIFINNNANPTGPKRIVVMGLIAKIAFNSVFKTNLQNITNHTNYSPTFTQYTICGQIVEVMYVDHPAYSGRCHSGITINGVTLKF